MLYYVFVNIAPQVCLNVFLQKLGKLQVVEDLCILGISDLEPSYRL
jgi:hypothetical protein